MKSYVTYSQDGSLTGGFLQEPAAEHANIVEVPANVRMNWPMYRANESRDGVELLPPVQVPTYTPSEVDKVQIVLALDAIGIDEAEVDRVVNLAPDASKRKEARLRWKHTAKVRRNSPFVSLLAQIKGLSEAEVDDLFRTAITL